MSNVHRLQTSDPATEESDQSTTLPTEDSAAFWEADERIKRELVQKFAWTAQHRGIVYRGDPMAAPPMREYEFNRISRYHHSFHYRDRRGKTRKHYYRMEEILVGLDDPDMDFGFICAEGVEFMPGEPELATDDLGRKLLNLWKPPGWGIAADNGEPTIFLNHLSYLLDGDDAAIDHVLNYMAHMVQRPSQRVNHALLITSQAKGIGKSTLGTIMRRLVGERNSRVTQTKDLKGQFDGWLVGQLLIQVDEIYEYGNWDLANKLKPIITEPTVSVNIKYGPQVEVRNYARLILFSNHTAPIDLESGDRRYWVFDSQAQPRDPAYYEELNRVIDSHNGMNAIYMFLMQRDLTDFKPFASPPMTKAKETIIGASGNPLGHYITEAVESGHFAREFNSQDFTFDQLQRQLVRDGYGHHAKNMKELGTALEAAGVTKHRKDTGESRQRFYRLPNGPTEAVLMEF
jgi:hypothetical protein